jgi:hypothetical protein
MSYIRVIPRDLFNEASLLKCLGALYIALETAGDHRAKFGVDDVDRFDIVQNPDDGSLYVANLPFLIGGSPYHLSRPLNSRAPWPLYAQRCWPGDRDDDSVVSVFCEDGKLSGEFLRLINLEKLP